MKTSKYNNVSASFDIKPEENVNNGRIPLDTPMRLVNEISRLIQQNIDNDENNGLLAQKSSRDLLIMLAIKDGVTQLDLVKRTHLKAPTVSVTLQKMEKEGYVSRRPDSYDLRATRVYLTEKGRELDEMMCVRIKKNDEIIMTGISKEDIETTVSVLKQMKANILNGGIINEAEAK